MVNRDSDINHWFVSNYIFKIFLKKIPTLSDGNLECEEHSIRKAIKKVFFLYPF